MRIDQQPVRIALFAPDGRMGQAIAAAIADDPGFALDNDHGDVLVDFSTPAALQQSLDRAVSAGIPLLIGTTERGTTVSLHGKANALAGLNGGSIGGGHGASISLLPQREKDEKVRPRWRPWRRRTSAAARPQ